MKKLVLSALFGILAACGGSKSSPDTRIFVDGGIDGPPAGDVCNVLADTGCQANEKCTWVIDLWTGNDATGRVACAPAGTVALNGSCMIGTGGMMATGSDNCAKGLYCNGRVCKTVCDPNGGSPVCGDNLACANYQNAFANEGEAAKAGVCDPTCNPLTNVVDGTNVANCGGMLDTTITTVPGLPNGYPSRGCYGLWGDGGGKKSRWSCAGSGAKEGVQNFVLPARFFINSCAPGFFPGLSKGTGTMMSICSALCNPGDTHSASVANAGGVEIPNVVSTCNQRRAANFDCIYGWFFEVDNAGNYTPSPYSNLGVCLDWTKYNDTATPPAPRGICKTLAINADPAMDKAYNQGCRPAEAHPLLGGPVASGLRADMRHFFGPAFPMTLSAE